MHDTTTTPATPPAGDRVRTAADIADREVTVLAQCRLPGSLGDPEGEQMVVSRVQLGAMLRQAHPMDPVMRNEHGWWTYKLPMAGLSAEGDGFDELAAHAVSALRAKVAEVDPTGASGDPLVWLVLSSTDVELRSWLHIPH